MARALDVRSHVAYELVQSSQLSTKRLKPRPHDFSLRGNGLLHVLG